MSVVALRVPRVVANVTVAPPVVRLTPLRSRACILTTEVLLPLATIEAGLALLINE